MCLCCCMTFQWCLSTPAVSFQQKFLDSSGNYFVMIVLENASFFSFSFLQSANIMVLFQKFHPTGMGEAAKLSDKLLEHSSDAGSEIPDKVLKSRMPAKFHQPVRPTSPPLMVESVIFLFYFIFWNTHMRRDCYKTRWILLGRRE